MIIIMTAVSVEHFLCAVFGAMICEEWWSFIIIIIIVTVLFYFAFV